MEVTEPDQDRRQWTIPVTEPSQVAEARRRGAALGRAAGFDEEKAGALALVVTEAGTNLVRHGGGGEIVLRTLNGPGPAGVEVLALDRGQGISNVAESLADGYSSRGTPGTGLGAIRRQSDVFDLHSLPGRGTAIVSRLFASSPAADPKASPVAMKVGAVCLPLPGEEASGDAWAVLPLAGATRFFLVDGVGHGESAAEAASHAVEAFRANPSTPLVRLLETMHEALRPTRGAVAAIVELQPGAGVLRYAGVGNISGSVWSPGGTQRLVSMSGALGHTVTSLREFSYAWPQDGLLVLHSDGLQTRWSLDDYPGLALRDPSLVAGVLYRDWARGRDDVTVMVARPREVSP
jgi:anti-sigma regulatory factor (Ser/Thr protein kinase)